MGAVLLAKKTGHPILPFSITAHRFLKVRSWDQFQIPLPFTRALIDIGSPITVPKDADELVLQAKRDELQQMLDRLTAQGEQWRFATH